MHTSIIYETNNDSCLSVPINEALTRSFSSSDTAFLEIKKDEIKPCMGCFGCWTKANATNMGTEDPAVYFCTSASQISSIIEKIKAQIESAK